MKNTISRRKTEQKIFVNIKLSFIYSSIIEHQLLYFMSFSYIKIF